MNLSLIIFKTQKRPDVLGALIAGQAIVELLKDKYIKLVMVNQSLSSLYQ